MNLLNYIKKIYQLGRKTFFQPHKIFVKKSYAIRRLMWISIDRTRFTNAYFVAFHPLKKTILQSWLGLCSSGQKKKKIKLSNLNFRRTLRLFVKTLKKKLRRVRPRRKGRLLLRPIPTALRLKGSFTKFQIRETIMSIRKLKWIQLVRVKNVTPLHLFSGIRFKKQRRI